MESTRFLQSYIKWFDKLSDDDKYAMYHGQQRFTDVLDKSWMREVNLSFEDYRFLTGEQGRYSTSLFSEIKTFVMEIMNDPVPKKTAKRAVIMKKKVIKKPELIEFECLMSSDSDNEIEFT